MGKIRGQWGEVGHRPTPGPTNHPQNLAKPSALGWARFLVAKSFPGALWVGPGGFYVLLSGKWPQGGNRGSVGVTHAGPESTDTQGALAIWLWPCLRHTGGQHHPFLTGGGGRVRVSGVHVCVDMHVRICVYKCLQYLYCMYMCMCGHGCVNYLLMCTCVSVCISVCVCACAWSHRCTYVLAKNPAKLF